MIDNNIKGERAGGTAFEGLFRLLRQPWIDHALCAQTDPDLWFAERGQAGYTQQAKKICRVCPVQQECFDFAIENREVHGVWGGMTEQERRPFLPTMATCAYCDVEFEPPTPQRIYCSIWCARQAHQIQKRKYKQERSAA